MASFPVNPGIKTYIPWCCEEFADSGAAMGDDGLVGSLSGTYLVTCTIPYSVADGDGEIVGEIELVDGFGNIAQSVTVVRKVLPQDTLVMTAIVVAPESAVFRASVTHSFAGVLQAYPQSHMEICMLAPPSEVETCAGWTIYATDYNTNCSDPASDSYTALSDDVIIGFEIDLIECDNFAGGGEAWLLVDGVVQATIDIPDLGNPMSYSASSAGLNIPIAPGQTVSFDLTPAISGNMTFTAFLPGANADVQLTWVTCG